MFVMEVLGIRTRGFERKLSSTVVPTQLSPPASKSNIIFMADYVCSNTEAFQRLKEKEAGSDEVSTTHDCFGFFIFINLQ